MIWIVTCQSAGLSAVDETLPAGAVDPYAIRYDVTSSDPFIDLSTVVSAEFTVERQSGARETWAANVDSGSQTATFVRLIRLLQASDVPIPETIKIAPVMTGPGSVKFYAPGKTIEVQDPLDA